MNVMVETSGKDIGMYHYVEHFFNDDQYRKLVVHFDINDIKLENVKSLNNRFSFVLNKIKNIS